MKRQIERRLFGLQLAMLAGIIVFQALGQRDLAGKLFNVTFFLTFLLWMNRAAGRMDRKDGLVLAILALSGICVCVNGLLTGTAVSFSYFKKLMMFWTTLLFFTAMEDYEGGARAVERVFRWSDGLSVFLIAVFALRREEAQTLNGIVTMYLTFGFTNPNLTAVFLASLCMLELLQAARSWKGMLHLCLGGILAGFVYLTRARNAQLILVFFLVGLLAAKVLPERSLRVSTTAAVVLTGAPLVFALGYLKLASSSWAEQTFSFLIGEGKGLDSRMDVWSLAVNAFRQSPLVGAYSQISGGTGASQMHNSHLDLLASYGVAVFVLTWLFLILQLRGGGGRWSFCCRLCFASLLLAGLGEAMLFSGGMGVYLFGGIFLMLKKADLGGMRL